MLLKFSRDVAVATKAMQKNFQSNIVMAVQSKLRISKIILGLTLIAPLYPYTKFEVSSFTHTSDIEKVLKL